MNNEQLKKQVAENKRKIDHNSKLIQQVNRNSGKIDELILQMEMQNKELHNIKTDVTLIKNNVNNLIIFKDSFSNGDGRLPAIVKALKDNLIKEIHSAIKMLRKEFKEDFEMLACYDLKFDDRGKLQSRCRIANENEPLKADEKELK